MKYIASIAIWLMGIILTIILFLAVAFVTILLFPFDKKRKAGHAQCYWWSDLVFGTNPYWNLEITGLENIDKRKSYVMVANHQSLGDIVIIYKIRTQFKWIAKESLFRVPFVGWCMSLIKHIRLTRGSFGSIKKVYTDAAGWLRKDMSVLFFPEGTRSSTDGMNKFFNGAFKLAIREKKPVLPIAIKGTREAISKGGWVFNAKVKGSLKVLPAIGTENYGPRDFEKLRDAVYEKLEKA